MVLSRPSDERTLTWKVLLKKDCGSAVAAAAAVVGELQPYGYWRIVILGLRR